MTTGDFDYQRYLASREWALLKEVVRERSHGECERCGRGRYEATHHLTYERIGRESLEDVIAVCKGCHSFLSGKSSVDPREVAREEVRRSLEELDRFLGNLEIVVRNRRRLVEVSIQELAADTKHRHHVGISESTKSIPESIRWRFARWLAPSVPSCRVCGAGVEDEDGEGFCIGCSIAETEYETTTVQA